MNKEISKVEASGKMSKDAASGGGAAVIAGLIVSQYMPDLDATTMAVAVGVLTGALTGLFKFARNLTAQWLISKGFDMGGNIIR